MPPGFSWAYICWKASIVNGTSPARNDPFWAFPLSLTINIEKYMPKYQ